MIVQGDTTTTFCGALAAFYHGLPVAHVEAGLRTGDLRQPFPEEMNRVLTARLADTALRGHRMPRPRICGAKAWIRQRFIVTGNTGIDAVLIRATPGCGSLHGRCWPELDPRRS